jgi:hypothetical protein
MTAKGMISCPKMLRLEMTSLSLLAWVTPIPGKRTLFPLWRSEEFSLKIALWDGARKL